MNAPLRLGTPLWSLRPTLHNGPGWRVGIWFQGCSLRCTRRCLNPRMLDPVGGLACDVASVLRRLDEIRLEVMPTLEGVTILGGEPTDQPAALLELLGGMRALGLSTMVYTGHRIEELEGILGAQLGEFFRLTDLLVDGPFEAKLYDDCLAWRGSSNQRLLCLSARYSPAMLQDAFSKQRKAFSIAFGPDGTASVSGLQSRPAASSAEGTLARAGRIISTGGGR